MLPLRIALRYLRAPKSHSAVNIISAVATAGIAIATMAIVCVLSVFNGFTDLAMSRLSVFDTEFKVTPAKGHLIGNADSVAASVGAALAREGIAGVSVQPVVEEQGLAIFADRQLAIDIKGVPADYARAEAIDTGAVIDGALAPGFDPFTGHPYATIGVGVAIRLGARPDGESTVTLMAPRRRGRINPANPMGAFRADSAMVSGVFQLDQAEFDNTLVIIPIESARRLLDMSAEATAIEISVADGHSNLGRIEQVVKSTLGDSYVVADRLGQHSESYRMIAVEKWISLLLLVFILMIASFNVVSSISMLVLEKRGDISILSAVGAPSGLIKRIFFDQATLITIGGGLIGIFLGLCLCLAQQYGKFITLAGDPSQLSIEAYPVKVEATDLLVTALAVVAVAIVVGAAARAIVAATRTAHP